MPDDPSVPVTPVAPNAPDPPDYNAVPVGAPQNPKPRGAKPTPRHVLASADRFQPAPCLLASDRGGTIPTKLSFWLNNQTGDCVTAEEAFAKGVWSVMNGFPDLFIPDAEVGRWAKKYGYYDGAYLTEVMDTMAKDGFTVNGVNYHDGPYKVVDYSNESVLQQAILQGPVKIGIDANALPPAAGNNNGWYDVGSNSHFPSEDHCTGLCMFGPAEYIYQSLYNAGLLPTPAVPTALVGLSGYAHFTWNTIGFVTHKWLMSTCAEAWVRNPTTPEQAPTPVPPTPTPTPTPTPGSVTIPDQTIRLFGGLVSFTVKGGTYPVVYQSRFGITGAIWTDIVKLFTDFTANAPIQTIIADVWKIVNDLTGQGAPVVPVWQIAMDAFALITAAMSQNWPAAITALMKLLADFGFKLTRAELTAALAPGAAYPSVD